MKRFYLFLSGVLTATTMLSAPLTPEQALQRSAHHSTGQRLAAGQRFTASDLCYTLNSEGTPVLYVFSRPEAGYAIVSADDVAVPTLGYSEEGTFRADAMPENMAWWLGEYQREIAHARQNSRPLLNAIERPTRAPIAPLVTTRWNQGSPYNLQCPEVNGYHTYSGCVATAMAQVMKHHNWPVKGTGSNSYIWNNQTLSMNFGEQTFDWANMTDTYGSSSTDAENNAVAHLMYACGISVNMNYGLSGSGAMSSVVPSALLKYFDYGLSTTMISRSYTPLLDWENYIYRSLEHNAPCYYSGQNLNVGHAFVCDGYSSDGYFHFNWGWGGMSDGYFLLSALDPSSQGIGGSNDGYNINQSVIIEALPKSVNNTPTMVFASTRMVTASYDTVNGALSLTGTFRSLANGAVTVEKGLKVTEIQSNRTAIYGEGTPVTVNANRIYTTTTVTVPRLGEGLYTVTPMVRNTTGTDTVWQQVLMPLGEPTIAYMQIDEDGVEFSYPEYDLMSAENLELQTPLYADSNYKLKFKIKNTLPTEVYEFFLVGLIQGNNVVAMCDPYSVDLMGGDSEDITYVGNFGFVSPGTYDIGILQAVGNQAYLISERLPVTLAQAPSVSDFSIQNLSVADNDNVNCSDIRFSFRLNNNEGYFFTPVHAYIFPGPGGSSITGQGYEPIYLPAGEYRDVNYTLSAPYLPLEREYILGLYINGSPQASTTFRVKTNSVATTGGAESWQLSQAPGFAMITADGTLTGVSLYNMSGMAQDCASVIDGNTATVSTEGLVPGVYLLRASTATSTRTFKLVK